MNIPRPHSGLSVLLGSIESEGRLVHVPVNQIDRNTAQPRTFFEPAAIASLAASIEAQGVIQPIAVRQRDGNRFMIIAGERRWLAACQAGLRTIPAVVHEADDRDALVLALAENVVREDLNPLEMARAYAALLDEFGMSVAELARALGKSRPSVANTLRLLELPDDVLRAIEERRLSEGHGRALLQLTDRSDQRRMARHAIERALSVRALEARARAMAGAADHAIPAGSSHTEQPRHQVSQELEARFNRVVERRLQVQGALKVRASGAVKVELSCESIEALESLVERLELATR